ncbi:hypothetical protein [Rhizobium sp. SSA_523]|uniref:hypothetical protein n=1 Tax=Rhizobium sp. SSA_523 TaxID=2952477 RepID=UPI002091C5AD|nr:hypothetical protein [Rhizobium sp. SSA_523]MCO5730109.1 hypothetical protein [Rhizobium sp. SSA_523]WKC25174.1 hypothetical protein QTJ18_14395 [Rhizobium sp. SSA_523]
MDAKKLAADFTGPVLVERAGEVRFYWEGNKKLFPRTRFRLEYQIGKRLFTLTRFTRLRSGSSKEMKRSIYDPNVIDVFRSALLPEQVAEITRLSMQRTL